MCAVIHLPKCKSLLSLIFPSVNLCCHPSSQVPVYAVTHLPKCQSLLSFLFQSASLCCHPSSQVPVCAVSHLSKCQCVLSAIFPSASVCCHPSSQVPVYVVRHLSKCQCPCLSLVVGPLLDGGHTEGGEGVEVREDVVPQTVQLRRLIPCNSQPQQSATTVSHNSQPHPYHVSTVPGDSVVTQ